MCPIAQVYIGLFFWGTTGSYSSPFEGLLDGHSLLTQMNEFSTLLLLFVSLS